ncbi:DUF72 domain-containing protein [Paenibacillus thermoaerophilus]|uniref:DUF72 domain-containing protein n=1 Tax=Paenibacillus thermoaerophilus TaxID=1215385 RepID=A0ABW2V3M2_9BACL|nr:DUF72 domain-containing protein [Paenibacillus thermoaerophilus]TMV17754.1 DUF72 domain-containing protein [Paenibacillus thermoaerophilus]
MIVIGLAGWGDHDSLYEQGIRGSKLSTYAEHFLTVEVDSSFYAIQPARVTAKWVDETPSEFRFVVKAYQGMTGHERRRGGGGRSGLSAGGASGADADFGPYASEEAIFAAFADSLAPIREAGKLGAVLFQFPPWFDCTREHVQRLCRVRELASDWPAAIEFRHQSWYSPEYRERTLAFLREQGWMHAVCDEPQVMPGSVPIVPAATHSEGTVVRFHGRNAAGWRASNAPNWREVRYLYDYSERELAEWKPLIQSLEAQSRNVYVIFNNNSGGHAAGSAKKLMALLGQRREPDIPRQMELF